MFHVITCHWIAASVRHLFMSFTHVLIISAFFSVDFFLDLFFNTCSLLFSWAGSPSLHMDSLATASRGYPSLQRPSPCSDFSCCQPQALGPWASVVAAHGLNSWGSQALELSLSSCGTCHGMWVLPEPGIKPVSFILPSWFLTTGPLGKPLSVDFWAFFVYPRSEFFVRYVVCISFFPICCLFFHTCSILLQSRSF